MATIVEDCPRCKSNRMTFDILADVWVGSNYGWQTIHEIYALCRRCQRASPMKVKLNEIKRQEDFKANGKISLINGDIEPLFLFDSHCNLSDVAAQPFPEHLPPDIEAAFVEGTKCLAIACPNAAASMFRLCLDLATKGLLPPSDQPEPDRHTRRNLAPRLEWLFETGRLPVQLQALSKAVKDNGNDGAHDGSLTAEDAEDIYDFAFMLLERLFTEPERLVAAARRAKDRRNPPAHNA